MCSSIDSNSCGLLTWHYLEYVYPDPATDETNFHPPYLDAGVISAGWATGTRYYHTTGDYENTLVRPEVLEKQGRAYAYVIVGRP